MTPARLLLPALRWDARHGWDHLRDEIRSHLRRGVGGFVLFGGEAEATRALTDRLHAAAPHPLLVASDLERGAGQQFRGATALPPAAALASLADPDIARRAGALTGREARALGVGLVLAPVADLDVEPANPIVGTRAWGREPERAAALVAAWVEGCRAGGALCCAKHWPGHGRTTADSHAVLPRVDAPRARLEAEWLPFRAAAAAGADALMTAHVAYPSLDPSGRPATLSAPLMRLLRDRLAFGGLVVTDALDMRGVSGGERDEPRAAVAALNAGCDALLMPTDAAAVAAELERALVDGRLPRARLDEALARVARAARAAERAGGGATGGWGRADDAQWAEATAARALRVLRGSPRLPRGPAVRLVVVDDDLGGPHPPPPRDALRAGLRQRGAPLSEDPAAAPLLALFADVRAYKGRPELSPTASERVATELTAHPDATLLLFGPPARAGEIPQARHVLGCWGGEEVMQRAAAGALRAN